MGFGWFMRAGRRFDVRVAGIGCDGKDAEDDSRKECLHFDDNECV